MQKGIMISGTGGQGIVAAGEFLSDALFRTGYDVINSRSYGSEARGGSCRSEVLVSDDEIYDLSLGEADILVILSTPAFRRYLGRAKKGALVLVDSKVMEEVGDEEFRRDVELIPVSATEIAIQLGNAIVANMVLLGALSGKMPHLISLDQLKEAIKEGMRPSMQEINFKAIESGHSAVN
ncbi:MAG: 2-oxoacid:acceptor oxidoreductase family protein [Candidatus Bathyarchaeota archaeon]|jgi:2-oxoglutarate ferredoxin oxidoreductase subunit gamma